MTSSPLYAKARKAIGHGADFGSVVGGMVGTTTGASRFDESTVVNIAMQVLIQEDGTPAWREDLVRKAIGSLREFVKANERHSFALIPLPGLKSALFPVELEPGVEIDVFTEEEVIACASTGVLRTDLPGVAMLTGDDCVGVRIDVTTPAVVSPPGSEPDFHAANAVLASPHRFGDRSPMRIGELVEDVLFVLRLARSEPITTRGVVLFENSHMGKSYSWTTRPTRLLVKTSYAIDEETSTSIEELWRLLRRQRRKRSLPSICLRRFNAALDRTSIEDAIIDHLIAAEALLLRDAGSPEDRGELGFRLSLRASALLGPVGFPRRATFKFLKRAYDLRSTIAHGGNAPQKVSVAGREALPIGQFVDELAQLIRSSLRTAVTEYSARPDFATTSYWDDLLLGPNNAPVEM